MGYESSKIIRFVDIYGHFGDRGLAHYYVFHNGDEELATADRKYINDLRELPQSVDKAYATFCTPAGWWLARVGHNPHDSRKGFAMVSVCTGMYRPANGGDAVRLLDALFTQLVDKQLWSDVYTRDLIKSHTFEAIATPLLQSNLEKSLGRGAFRTYADTAILNDYMSSILQLGHDEYARVFFIEDSCRDTVAQFIPQITTPFKKLYSVVCENPAVTRVSHTEALTGETISVEYNVGGSVRKHTFRAGESDRIISAKGSVITVLDPANAGVWFAKTIILNFRTPAASQIKSFVPAIPDLDLERNNLKYDSKTCELSVSADTPPHATVRFRSFGFDEVSTHLEFDKLKDGTTVDIPVQPKRLTLVFKTENKEYRADRPVEYLSPEYRDLVKSGARVDNYRLVMKGVGFDEAPKSPVKEDKSGRVEEPVKKESIIKPIILGIMAVLAVLFAIGAIRNCQHNDSPKVELEKAVVPQPSPAIKADRAKVDTVKKQDRAE